MNRSRLVPRVIGALMIMGGGGYSVNSLAGIVSPPLQAALAPWVLLLPFLGESSLALQIDRVAEAERVFREMAEGGRVVVPLQKTFWAERFGMVVDRFGIPWLLNCEGSQGGAEEGALSGA